MNFIVNLNKPSGMTSQQAVTRVKRMLTAKKAGHTGTLDPLATGVLLVCLNETTKISRFFLEMDKRYRATVKLGERTDTYDSGGRITDRKDISSLSEDDVRKTVSTFTGRIKQKPPMYSAIKIGGQTLYKLARKGIEIDRPERTAEIYDLKITAIKIPYFDIEISCSKGTYIRTLCDDIGVRLGTGAHMTALERTGIGFFDIKDSVTLDDLGLETWDKPDDVLRDRKYLCPPDVALCGLPEIILNEDDFKKAVNGAPVISGKIGMSEVNELIRLKGPLGNLFGIGRINSGVIYVERILKL